MNTNIFLYPFAGKTLYTNAISIMEVLVTKFLLEIITLNPIRLGGVILIPLGQKNFIIFKWLKVRICDLYDFYRKYKGKFLANFGGHKYFFRIFTDFSSES